MISSEFGPRSTASPVWIRTTSPPVQWPLLSTTLAERRISRQAEKSPCRSPTATMRCKGAAVAGDRKSTRLNSSHSQISYAVFCLKKKKITHTHVITADVALRHDTDQWHSFGAYT